MEIVGNNIIIKGVFEQFERLNRSNGRTYPIEAFEQSLKRIVPLKRMSKIKKLWKETTLPL